MRGPASGRPGCEEKRFVALLDAVVRNVALVIAVITVAYNGPLVLGGVLFARRSGALRGQLAARDGAPAGPPAGWAVFVMVPCLNEARVVGNTVRCLLDSQPGVRVVVVDDGS